MQHDHDSNDHELYAEHDQYDSEPKLRKGSSRRQPNSSSNAQNPSEGGVFSSGADLLDLALAYPISPQNESFVSQDTF